MNRSRTLPLSIVTMALAAAAACDSEQPTGDQPSKGAASAASKAPASKAPKTAEVGAVRAARKPLEAYEEIRASLADDDASELPQRAGALAESAREATPKPPAKAKKHLASIAEAADALAKTSPDDLDAVREAFGEVSRHVIELLVNVPHLQKGHHIFHCPMAQGYGKWVQPSERLENPYMGEKMLRCGSESDWES